MHDYHWFHPDTSFKAPKSEAIDGAVAVDVSTATAATNSDTDTAAEVAAASTEDTETSDATTYTYGEYKKNMDERFGWIVTTHQAPVWLGEFGWDGDSDTVM